MKTYCPNCREQRKDKRDKSVSVNLSKGIAYCHYCGETFRAKGYGRDMELTPIGKHESNTLPPPRPTGTPPQAGSHHPDLKVTPPPAGGELAMPNDAAGEPGSGTLPRFFAERKISEETLKKAGISFAEEYMPQTRKKEWCVCFNYFEEGRLVNVKFRDLNKNFKMTAGAEVIPYNIDGILGKKECIATEGEMDTLSFMEIGRDDVISVPTGANKNLAWMDRFMETYFEDKEVIYIAVDTDRKGQELCRELMRRLGAERCRVVTYPEGCKDANEVLVKHGKEALIRALEEAPETPLEGVYTASDVKNGLRMLFERGMERGAETGWENFDRFCTFELGRLCVVTGIPGAGKSEFVDELVIRLNLRHKWKAAFFSPENMPLEYHLRKWIEKVSGGKFREGYISEEVYQRAERYVNENLCSILPKDNFRIDTILGKARELVRRRGIKILVVDPFNRFEHQIPNGQTETQYINQVLDVFTNFALRHQCLVILVAHPKKMYKEPGSLREPVPTLYDISGSAAFFNKCDFGLTVERDKEAKVTRVHIQKVKFRHLGTTGNVEFLYNIINGRLCGKVPQTGFHTGNNHAASKPGCSASLPLQLPQLFDNEEWIID